MPKYSVIVPVYNRPDEVAELLESLVPQTFQDFEVLIVEDGSTVTCEEQVNQVREHLTIEYFFKENSGPSLARNFGATHSKGDWLIFLDSDCFVDPDYFESINSYLSAHDVDSFGGPDREHPSFSSVQRGINYSMTSFLTTGGIRGGKKSLVKFKPRSFNMGVHKEVFLKLGGFRDMRFGEDIDLSLKIQKNGYQSGLIEQAFAYHKRRSTFWQFYKQVYNSGVARIVLTMLHPQSLKSVHFLPSLFLIGQVVLLLGIFITPLALIPVIIFPILVLLDAAYQTRSLRVGCISIITSYIQLFGYGFGFIIASFSYLSTGKIRHSFEKNLYD